MEKKTNNRWKIVAASTAIAAIGLAGVTFAGGGEGIKDLPDSIRLRDKQPVAEAHELHQRSYDIVGAPIIERDDSLDSPFDSANDSFQQPLTPAIVPVDASGSSDWSADSPDTWSAPQAPAAAPEVQYDSADSFDSPEYYSAPSQYSPPAQQYSAPVQSAPSALASGSNYTWSDDSVDSFSFDSAGFSS